MASNYKKRGVDFREFYEKTYLPYKKGQLLLTGVQKEDITEKKEETLITLPGRLFKLK